MGQDSGTFCGRWPDFMLSFFQKQLCALGALGVSVGVPYNPPSRVLQKVTSDAITLVFETCHWLPQKYFRSAPRPCMVSPADPSR